MPAPNFCVQFILYSSRMEVSCRGKRNHTKQFICSLKRQFCAALLCFTNRGLSLWNHFTFHSHQYTFCHAVKSNLFKTEKEKNMILSSYCHYRIPTKTAVYLIEIWHKSPPAIISIITCLVLRQLGYYKQIQLGKLDHCCL